jgi:predicted nucleic acid-binding protein
MPGRSPAPGDCTTVSNTGYEGELYYGAYKSSRVTENIAKINEFAAKNAVLISDTATAQAYGRIKSGLRAEGDQFQRMIFG